MLSMIITSKTSEILASDNDLLSFARQLAFFNEEIFEKYCQSRVPMTSREIAAELGISEQSISRAYKNFVSLIR